MKKLTNFFKRSMKSESGQGATEYILLLVVIVGLVAIFGPEIKKIVDAKVKELKESVQAIK